MGGRGGGGYVGMAVLTAASCLHDLIYEDMLLIGSGMPAVENRFKCTFAVRGGQIRSSR